MGEGHLGRGNSTCKGPEVERYLVCSGASWEPVWLEQSDHGAEQVKLGVKSHTEKCLGMAPLGALGAEE